MRVASDAARHNLATCDANMHTKRSSCLGADLGHRLVDRLGGVDRAQRIIAVRHGCTEDGHDAIADMLVDRATVVANDGIGPVDELAEDGVQFFRIQFCGELCVAG